MAAENIASGQVKMNNFPFHHKKRTPENERLDPKNDGFPKFGISFFANGGGGAFSGAKYVFFWVGGGFLKIMFGRFGGPPHHEDLDVVGVWVSRAAQGALASAPPKTFKTLEWAGNDGGRRSKFQR